MNAAWRIGTEGKGLLSLAASPEGRWLAWGEKSGKIRWLPLAGDPLIPQE